MSTLLLEGGNVGNETRTKQMKRLNVGNTKTELEMEKKILMKNNEMQDRYFGFHLNLNVLSLTVKTCQYIIDKANAQSCINVKVIESNKWIFKILVTVDNIKIIVKTKNLIDLTLK